MLWSTSASTLSFEVSFLKFTRSITPISVTNVLISDSLTNASKIWFTIDNMTIDFFTKIQVFIKIYCSMDDGLQSFSSQKLTSKTIFLKKISRSTLLTQCTEKSSKMLKFYSSGIGQKLENLLSLECTTISLDNCA